MSFTKSELVFDEYNWLVIYGPNDPRVSGNLDSTHFNRGSGHEMLYFINYVGEKWLWIDDKNKLKALEKIIRLKLPVEILTQLQALRWLELNITNVQT